MKDNNENLNNELNDDEMEAVAGGACRNWSPMQGECLRRYLKAKGDSSAYNNAITVQINQDPDSFLELARECMGEDEAYKELEKGLNIWKRIDI